ncbi:MAG: HlyC/CorC family transporter [Chloroflexi bacterium]|nr:HlyC/CorC family transporter [Chloroflexota bacterium]
MRIDDWLALGFLFLCLALLAFVTIAEVGLTSIIRGRGKHLVAQGIAKTQIAEELQRQLSLSHATIIVAKSLAVVGFAAATVALAQALREPGSDIMVPILLAGILVLILSQVIPRNLASRNPERAVILVASGMAALTFLFTPLLKLAFAISRLIPASQKIEPNTEDLLTLVELESNGEPVEAEERQMIRGIFELEEKEAKEIMVPRIDIVAVDSETPLTEVADVIVERGRSRIPIYEDTIDKIIGIVYAKDLLGHLARGETQLPIKDIARPALFVPESKKIDELLREFRQKRVHIAIVVDEYGGTAGLVTIEDLLEEIVGEIADEYDTEEIVVQKISDEEAIIDARASISELNELFNLYIQGEDFNTVGGFVYARLGRIPNVGDTVTTDGLTISILSTQDQRIKKVRAIKSPPPSAETGSN